MGYRKRIRPHKKERGVNKKVALNFVLIALMITNTIPFMGYANDVPEEVEVISENELENELEDELEDDLEDELEDELEEVESVVVLDEEEASNVHRLSMMSTFSMLNTTSNTQREAVAVSQNTKMTNEPINVTVAGTLGRDVSDIQMVSSPELGRNHVIDGAVERDFSNYEIGYALRDHWDIRGKQLTVSFDAKIAREDTSVDIPIETIIYGGKSYDIGAMVSEDFQRFTYVIPAEDVRELGDYTRLILKKGNTDWLRVKNVKLEVGDTATPFTPEARGIRVTESVNLFSRTEWLSTTPEEKPKTTTVPYLEMTLEPNTEYTLSTNIRRSSDGWYEVFFTTPDDPASSGRNGVALNEPRTITTRSDGRLRVAMRHHDDELRDGTKYIQLNKGSHAVPHQSRLKTYPVTANGLYTFEVTYTDGEKKTTSVDVNNYITMRGVPYKWVDSNLQVTLDGSGGNNSLVKRVQLPNNQWVNGDKATFNVTDNGVYRFIAEDANGNRYIEDVEITQIDKFKPTISTSQNVTEWTNQAVDIEVFAFDAESGIDIVEMTGRPSSGTDGGWDNLFLNSNFAFGLRNWTDELALGGLSVDNNTLTAYGQGRFFYSIIALPMGEVYTISFDAKKEGEPSLVYAHHNNRLDGTEGTLVTNEWERHTLLMDVTSNQTVSFRMQDTVNKHYFRNMKLEKGTEATPWIPASGDGVGRGSMTFPVVANGEYTFTATDYAGNKAEAKHTVSNIDSTPPEITITPDIEGYTTNSDINLGITVSDSQSGVKSVTLPDGNVLTNQTSTTYKVSDNGDYQFIVEDNVGNRKVHTETITSFDREAPTLEITGNPTDWVEDDEVVLTVKATDAKSGVHSITLPDGQAVNGDSATFATQNNGDYTFSVRDNLGNSRTYTVKVEHIMTPYLFYLFGSNGMPIQGAEFALLRDGVIFKTATSDGSGLVDFGKVPPTGRYTVRQTKAPDGHVTDPNDRDVDVGDTTDPEEFVSYPRGKELPATGTYGELIWLGLATIPVGCLGVWFKERKKIINNIK